MYEFALAGILGIVSGILIGLLPSISTTVFLVMFAPFFIEQSLIFCVTFYAVAMSTSQYFGSVTTLTFGIPGENTSLPLLTVRSKLLDNLKEIHFLCATGSLFASIVSASILFFIIGLFQDVVFYIKSYFALGCAVIGFLLCLRYSDNSFLISILLIILGWLVGKIGYNYLYNETFFTFNNSYLYGGIPILPALLGIYALPNLYKLWVTTQEFSSIEKINSSKSVNYVKSTITMIPVMIRSTTIGFISGLIPYIGNSMSSYLAFMVEKKINDNKANCLAVAAETANNSANLSVLIPLLILGVAIVPSEFVLLEILNSSTQIGAWKQIFNNYTIFMITIISSCFISFYLAWMAVDIIVKIFHHLKKYFVLLLLSLVLVSIFIFGLENSQQYYYLFVLFVFSIFGFIMKNYDLLPFVYAFLLQNNIEEIIYRVYNIYL